MEENKKTDFYEFCKIIEKLRAPGGCPWDREQTHETLAKHLLEEAYEAYDAIETGDGMKIADELGDVLLQIVMHAQVGKEAGTFDIDDVTDLVSRKMIERHPHVFGDVTVKDSNEVLSNWDDIKKKERGQKKTWEALEDVTRSLPALYRAEKIIGKADKAGFIDNEEMTVLSEEEIGENLFRICIISRKSGVNAEEALSAYTKNFIKKIKNIEENT